MHKNFLDHQILKSASERGQPLASYLLSIFYSNGVECEASKEEGDRFLKLARSQCSLQAARDVALRVLAGLGNEMSVHDAWETLGKLAEQGLDRGSLGEKLLFSGRPEFVRKGYEILTLHSYQPDSWRARFLVALSDAVGNSMEIPAAEQDQQMLLRYLSRESDNPPAMLAFCLGSLLHTVDLFPSRERLVERMIATCDPRAAIYALELLPVSENERMVATDFTAKKKLMQVVEGYAISGNIQAKIALAAELTADSPDHLKPDCAKKLVGLLRKHPEYHTLKHDNIISGCREADSSLRELHLDLARSSVESGLNPYTNRTLAIELWLADRLKEAFSFAFKAVNIGLPNSLHLLMSMHGSEYCDSGVNFEDTLFWHEAYTYESEHGGLEMTIQLMNIKKRKEGLTHAEVVCLKNKLESFCVFKEASAQLQLATMLINGDGPVLPDPQRGLRLLQQAAKTDGRAMYELAHVYQAGLLVPRDMVLAQHFFDLAAKNGHSNGYYDHLREEAKANERREKQEKQERQEKQAEDATQAQNVTPLFPQAPAEDTH